MQVPGFSSVFQAQNLSFMLGILNSSLFYSILDDHKELIFCEEKFMKKLAVCDDDTTLLSMMKEYLNGFETLFQIEYFQSGEELLSHLKDYDIIFLDIDMKGISGIDTARKIRVQNKRTKIVYVTAYEDYRDYAFSVHAFAYLVKPVTKEKIISAVKEAMAYTKEEISGPRIRFHCLEGYQEFSVEDIYYFEYQCRKICIVTAQGTFHFQEKIGNICEKMAEMGFASPHKSFVVNLSHIKGISGYELALTDNIHIPLSQKRSAQFRQIFTNYLAQKL